MATPNIPVGVEDVKATVANFRLYKFKKRLDEMRLMMQNAQDSLDEINTRAKKNVEDQKVINSMLEENKRLREALLIIKPPAPKAERPKLYLVSN